MFDQNNPDDLVLFRDEVTLDPITMGYSALPSTDTKKLLNHINDEAENVELPKPTAGAIFSHEVLMQTCEFKGTQNEQGPWVQALLQEFGDVAQYEAKYRATCGADALAALDALIYPLSRAEVLFGKGTVLSDNDWHASRDYTGDQ